MTTAVVVHYHGGAALRRCIDSCLAEGSITDVIVVDNSQSALGSSGLPAGVRVVEMPRNVGYGRAANVGLDIASGAGGAVVVLNQDVVVPFGGVGTLLSVAADSGASIVGPGLVDLEGRANTSGRRFPWRFRPPPAPARAASTWEYVAWLPGAVLVFPDAHAAPRFDERFFMYVEDEDLCAGVWESGGKVALAASVTFVHEGATAARLAFSPRSIAWRIFWGRIRMTWRRRGAGAAATYVTSRFFDKWRGRPPPLGGAETTR